MGRGFHIAVAGMLGAAAASVHAADWVDIEDPNELRALYSNKTHRFSTYVSYYRDDGRGLYVANGSDVRVPRVWRVQGNDQVCVGPKKGEPTCFRFRKNAENPAEMLGITESRGQRVMRMFTVEDGIPKF